MLVVSTLSPSMAQNYYIEDDIYYTPNDKNPVIEAARLEKEVITVTATPTNAAQASQSNYSQERDVDEYNRRYGYASYEAPVAEEGTQIDNTFVYSSDNVAPGDTLYIQMEDGYYLNGFNGSLSDYEYTVQIHRYYNPRYAVSISDPAYSSIYMLNSNDWNVYIDGSYAWVTPTWTNPWYWNYTWSPYSYSSWAWRTWGYGYYGWYSPWYDPWYYPGYHYGWYDPYYYHNPYHHHHHYAHHHHGYGHDYTHHGRGPGDYGYNRPGYSGSNKRPGNDDSRYGGSIGATSKSDSRRGVASNRGNRVVVNGNNTETPSNVTSRTSSSRNTDINTGRGTTTNSRTTINNNNSGGRNNSVSTSRSSSNSRGSSNSVNSSRSSSSSNRSSNVGTSRSSSSSSSSRGSSVSPSRSSSNSHSSSSSNTGSSRGGGGSRGGNRR